MRTTIVSVALGFLLLATAACNKEKTQPPDMGSFKPGVEPKKPTPPPPLPDPNKAKE